MQSSDEFSARRTARTLLAAWNSADLRQIQLAIDQAGAVETAGLAGDDAERVELVRGIGGVMREWMAGHTTGADLKTSLVVLHHIANVGAGAADRLS